MPRPKPFLSLFFGLFGSSAAIAALFAVVGVLLALGAGGKAAHLRNQGAETEATILALTEKHRSSTRRSSSHSHDVTYRFQVGPDTYTATASLPRDRFLALSVGDRIPVHYWTKDPTQSEIDFGDAANDSLAGQAIAIVATIAALVVGRMAWREAHEAAWMARHGKQSTAQITGHRRTSVRVNGLPLWRAEWRNPDGTTGRSGRKFFTWLPAVGQTVTILTDPEGRRPSRLQSDICT
jgi:hypothetical protein